MAFNEQSYRQAAADAGITSDEVEAEVARQNYLSKTVNNVVPENLPTNPASGKPFGSVVNEANKKNQTKAEKFGEENNSWQSWLNNPAVWVIGGAVLAEGARKGMSFFKDKLSNVEPTKIEPTYTPPTLQGIETPQVTPPVDLNAKIEAAKQANAARAATSEIPTSVAPSELVGPPPELVGPTIPPEAPAAPVAPKNMVGPPPELTGPIKPDIPTRVRRTTEKIATDKAAAIAAAPEGFHPQYPKTPTTMGPGAFNHLVNNVGFEKAQEIWLAANGPTNVPYSQYITDFQKAQEGPHQPLPEGVKPGGAFGKPTYIPNYIKGGASPALLAGMAGGTLAGLGAYQGYKKGQATNDWTDLGQIGMSLAAAGSVPATVALIGLTPKQLESGLTPQAQQQLDAINTHPGAREYLTGLKKASKSSSEYNKARDEYLSNLISTGSGRGSQGVPPP